MALSEWDPKRGRRGRQWRRLVKEYCPPGSYCQRPVCLYPELNRVIVFGLRRNHPHGPSLDHIVPLHRGGHPTDPRNLRPAHFGCNAAWRLDEKPPAPRLTSRAVVPVVTPGRRASRASVPVVR